MQDFAVSHLTGEADDVAYGGARAICNPRQRNDAFLDSFFGDDRVNPVFIDRRCQAAPKHMRQSSKIEESEKTKARKLRTSRFVRKDRLSRLLNHLAVSLFAFALLGAWLVDTTATNQKQWADQAVACLGFSIIVWGCSELIDGKVLTCRHNTDRNNNPVTFWLVILVFRFLIGAALIGTAVWQLCLETEPTSLLLPFM